MFALNPEQYTALENKPALGGIMKKNNFGFFSCYMLFFLFFMQETPRKRSLKNLSAGLVVIQFVVFIFSFTRAAWLGFLAALPSYLGFVKDKKKLLVPIVFLIFLGIILFPVIHYGLVGDLEQRREYGMSSFQWRLQYAWPASIEAFKKKPIMGWGLGSDLRALTIAAGLRKTSHNDYLLVLVETGLIGLMLYLWLLGSLLFKTLLNIIKSENNHCKSLSIAALSTLIAYMVGSVAEHLLQTPGATGYVITIISMSHGISCGLKMNILKDRDKI